MVWAAIAFAVIFLALLVRERRRSRAPGDGQFRKLLDSAPLGLVVFNATHVLYANQRVVDLVGIGAGSSVVGRRLDEMLAAEAAELARASYERIVSTREPVSVKDFAVADGGGTVIRCDLTMVPVVFDGAAAVQVALVPVEEKHLAVAALRRTEERFRRFFEEMPVPMYRTRHDGTIVHANAALAKLLGIEDPDELVGIDASTFYAEDGERDRLASIQRTQGLLEDQISMLVGADGRKVWVRDSSRTVVEEGAQTFEGALIDVTEGQLATRELEVRARQQQALAHLGQVALRSADVGDVLREAVEQICDVLDIECAVIARDQEGHGLLVTAAAYRTDSAHRREEILAYLQEHMPAGSDASEPVQLTTAAYGSGVGAVQGVALALAGSTEPYGVIGVGGTTMELSEEDCSFLVTTAAMLGSALERARGRAHLERLMRSKDEFVASVSHELRTPLTVVAGLSLELENRWRKFSPAEIAEFISLIADQSREMSNLIEDLLVAARADIGKVAIHLERKDFRSCVDQVVASCSLADRARITVAGSDIVGNIDPVRFRQVVRNLVTNAIRYGGPRIHIGIHNGDGGASVVVFDDGPGIPEEHRDRIFNPYERAHSTSGIPGSVGLGLAVSQKLAELMGGSISYRFDDGSYFELRLQQAETVSDGSSDVSEGPRF